MGQAFRKLFDTFFGNTEMRVVMLGLDAAGKTTILYKLHIGEVLSTVPTIGFNVEKVQYKNVVFTVWDVGGQEKLRPLWRHYFNNTDGLIYVVDSLDRERIGRAKAEFQTIVKDPFMLNSIILVFANKKMSLSLQSPLSSALSSKSSILQKGGGGGGGRLRLLSGSLSSNAIFFKLHNPSFPQIRASSLDAGASTELDAVSSLSEIVPDTVVFDDFQKFPPTAATVSSSLLLGICSLPDTIFRSAVDTALADSGCSSLENDVLRLSCFANKALVNVGGDLSKLVPGRVSTEVDARLAYDTHGIIRKVHDLLKSYGEIDVPPERLLFKIPATWQGIEASRLLESEGIQTHLTFVYSFVQAAAAAQAGASVIQIFVGRLRDWSRNHSGDPEIEAALKRGEDPGLALVTKAYNYIHKYGYKSKLMAAAVRNKQDLFSLLGVDYIIAPLKVMQSLKESITTPDEKYSFVRRLSPHSAAAYSFSEEELIKWDQLSLASAMGPASVGLLAAGLDGYVNQAKRVEELFAKIWPPPNV